MAETTVELSTEQRGLLLLMSAEERCAEIERANPELATRFWIQCRYKLAEELGVSQDDLLDWRLQLEKDEIELEDFRGVWND